MSSHTFEWASELPVSAETVWKWYERPGAFERLAPPWELPTLLSQEGTIGNGRVVLEVPIGPVRQRWVALHTEAEPGRRFVDVQESGPFARWVHEHRFEPLGPDRCRCVDQIEYALPFGAAGELAAPVVARRLERTFRYRHATLAQDLGQLAALPADRPRTVVVTGATGLIGGALVPFLRTGGFRVRRLTRRPSAPEDFRWDPAAGTLDPAALDGADAVVHLAGESIAAGRWTPARKRQILESRTVGTGFLAERLAALRPRPAVLISASAVGIYGDRGDEPLTETAPLRAGPEASFVEQVGHAWEAAAAPADQAGIRVVRARLGIILTPLGGALGKMLPPFLAGMGGRMGDGRQVMSWIGLDDVLGALLHALVVPTLRGPVNLTAPAPLNNAEFTRVLGRVLGRPTLLPVPPAALRLALGEMADELLLTGARVLPDRLLSSGYRFRHDALEAALRHVLGR